MGMETEAEVGFAGRRRGPAAGGYRGNTMGTEVGPATAREAEGAALGAIFVLIFGVTGGIMGPRRPLAERLSGGV